MLTCVVAIGIDQNSPDEKNHQVRLMAEIYAKADVVIAWLGSPTDSTEVAFDYVQSAASGLTEAGLYSVEKLCSTRYWTRKWIIQELVTAQSVVLRAGKLECPMVEFEKFCNRLKEASGDHRLARLSGTSRGIVEKIAESQAWRIALQRLESSQVEQPRPYRLLYELIETYQHSECKELCDHVYALGNLADSREHLVINYKATPVERFVSVLDFVHRHERMDPSKTVDFARLLFRLFRLHQVDFAQDDPLLKGLLLLIPIIVLGPIEWQPETQGSRTARKTIVPFTLIPTYGFDTSQNTWISTGRTDIPRLKEKSGRLNMTYFSIPDSHLHGLAACKLHRGDTIWHLPNTRYVFGVKTYADRQASIVGRAYLYNHAPGRDSLEPLECEKHGSIQQGVQQNIHMTLATLLELAQLAMRSDGLQLTASPSEARSLSTGAEATQKARHLRIDHRGIMIVMCCKYPHAVLEIGLGRG